jgi:hypothetical protein
LVPGRGTAISCPKAAGLDSRYLADGRPQRHAGGSRAVPFVSGISVVFILSTRRRGRDLPNKRWSPISRQLEEGYSGLTARHCSQMDAM